VQVIYILQDNDIQMLSEMTSKNTSETFFYRLNKEDKAKRGED
jgi:hypothetical protein